jgi:S-DNA-T family DNA segregation ATPase FtsK/SpoIIIE
MQYRSDILGNIHVRMMMRMTDSDVQTLEDFGARGKSLIQRLCDKTGMVVVKDGLGDDDSVYKPGKVALLSAEERTMRLATLAMQNPSHPIVFDGYQQPVLSENPQCMGLLAAPSWLGPKEMEMYAHNSERRGGLDDAEWLATECPHVTWLGQEFNVHGQAKIIFRRRSAQNALLLGEANQPRYGMLAAMLVGLCVSGSANNTQCIVLDNSIEGTSWSQILSWTCNRLPESFVQIQTKKATSLEQHLGNLEQELKRRQRLDGVQLVQEPSIFVFLTEADRVHELRREVDAYGSSYSELGKQLLDLLAQGPELGLHVILSFANLKKMEMVFDRRESLRSIQHRVGLRMPEDNFLDLGFTGRHIADIQHADSRPICALYLDMERSTDLLFKPYTVEDAAENQSQSVTASIEAIGTILRQRRFVK